MAAVAPGAASAELVTGWCIFGLLLLVGEALGVFPVLRLVGDRKGPALSPSLRPGRPSSPRPAPLSAWTMGSPSSPGPGALLAAGGEEARVSGCFRYLFPDDI